MGDLVTGKPSLTNHLCELSLASPGLLNRVPASSGVKAASHLCQVTLCDLTWYVSSRSGDRRLRLQTAIRVFTFLPFQYKLISTEHKKRLSCLVCVSGVN